LHRADDVGGAWTPPSNPPGICGHRRHLRLAERPFSGSIPFHRGLGTGCGPAIERDAVGVTHAGSAEEIEGGADGEVDAAAADPMDGFEVVEGAGAAGVGHGDGRPIGEMLDEGVIDAGAKPFHIDGMDQELGAGIGKGMEGVGAEGDIGELLPAIGHDPVLAVADPATEIEHDAGSADPAVELIEAFPVDAAVAEDPGSEDHMGGTGGEPVGGIVGMNAAAVLEASGPGGEGFAGGLFVAGAESDDMAAVEKVVAVQPCEPCGRLIGLEPGSDTGAGVGEGASHDLDDASTAEVNAGSEHGWRIPGLGDAH
jgi:hypothetical protein